MNSDNQSLVKRKTGYSTLLCYRKSVVVYDLTYHFCARFLDKRDRTYDQMIQAARSGKQNIVEGYVDAATSMEVALKLLNIARGSLQELIEDYRDYLRTRNLEIWEQDSDKVKYMRELGKKQDSSDYFINLAENRNDETIANMAIVLINQADVLIYKYIEFISAKFIKEGGFREKLTRVRIAERNNHR
jgi:four helix bundle suffix protein